MRCLSRHRFWSLVEPTTHCFFIRSRLRQRSRAPFKVIAGFLVPADQHTSEAIHPTMGAFYPPSSCFETGLLLECLGFFPARPDVRREAKLVQEFPDLVIVITFIEAQPPLAA